MTDDLRRIRAEITMLVEKLTTTMAINQTLLAEIMTLYERVVRLRQRRA